MTVLYAILRHKKIGLSNGQWNKVNASNRHNNRLGFQKNNIDSGRTHFNQLLIGSNNLIADAKERLKKLGIKRVRKNAVVIRERVATASPEFFGNDWKSRLKDPVFRCKLDDWVKANQAYFKKKFGDNVIQMTLHLDEETPHLHVMIMPIVPDGPGWQLSAKEEVRTKATLRKYQDEYAEALQHLGLTRGQFVEDTGSTHEHFNAYKNRKTLENRVSELEKQNEKLERQLKASKDKAANLEQEAIFLRKKAVEQDRVIREQNEHVQARIQAGFDGYNAQIQDLKQQYETELDHITINGKRTRERLQAQPIQQKPQASLASNPSGTDGSSFNL